MMAQPEWIQGRKEKCIRNTIMGFAFLLILYSNNCFAQTMKESHDIKRPLDWLVSIMDQYHSSYDVYTDAFAAGNHFLKRDKISSPGDENALPDMDEFSTENPHSGQTCIKATFTSQGSNWGGWLFMNGVLQRNNQMPVPNFGDVRNAGVDLRGATKLTFFARGRNGGERVEFFAFGIGREPASGNPIKIYPDSSPKVSLGNVPLTKEWKEYTIDLKKKDLSYVLGGFGWTTNAPLNKSREITFYIDDIRYNNSRKQEPHFLLSYATIPSNQDVDKVMRNVGFTYDNALALMAFLAAGDHERAKLIADAFVYAQKNDRLISDGRIRNAYQGGDLSLPPGWEPQGKKDTIRMPGWYDPKKQKWCENELQVSTHTGNAAWVMLALVAYFQNAGGEQYLNSAEQLGNWIENNCKDTRGKGGYTGGVEGWEKTGQNRLAYKSAEHNLDLYCAFQRLYLITKDNQWRNRANHAKLFLLSMWDETEGKFWIGTTEDGVTINKDLVPVDVQAWAVMALREEGTPYWKALTYAQNHLQVGHGFDFNEDKDGIWYEGTAQMALAYKIAKQGEKAVPILQFLQQAIDDSGGLYAANKDNLTTGIYLQGGEPWLYYHRLHAGATAWLIFAEKGVNPFWMGAQ